MHRLVLLRHGESTWNKDNRFTGWTDVPLSERGLAEARQAGRILKEKGFVFDIAFTSLLTRAIRTLWLVLAELDLLWIPVRKSWRLNERHYGALQGLDKEEIARKYGSEQVLLWRRSYSVRPPPLEKGDPRHPGYASRYRHVPAQDLPVTESLEDTVKRLLPYWRECIAPEIRGGKRAIISAHGNSLRALVKYVDGNSDDDVVQLNIPTGIPLVYEFDSRLKPIAHYYLGDTDLVQRAMKRADEHGQAP